MEGRFSAGEGDSERAEVFQFPQLRIERGKRNWLAGFIELRAIGAGKVTAPDDDHLRQERAVAQAEGRARGRVPPSLFQGWVWRLILQSASRLVRRPAGLFKGWPGKSYWLNIGNYPRQSISIGVGSRGALGRSMKVAILADAPAAFVELCGMSLLERLLRTLQRAGVPEVVILSSNTRKCWRKNWRSLRGFEGDSVDIAKAPAGSGENRGNSGRRLGRRVVVCSAGRRGLGRSAAHVAAYEKRTGHLWLILLRRRRLSLTSAECP